MRSNVLTSIALYVFFSFAISIVAHVATLPAPTPPGPVSAWLASGGRVPEQERRERLRRIYPPETQSPPPTTGEVAVTRPPATEQTESGKEKSTTTTGDRPSEPQPQPQAVAQEDYEKTVRRFAYEYLVPKVFNSNCDKSRWYSMRTINEDSDKVERTYYEVVNPQFEVNSTYLEPIDRELNKFQFYGSVVLTGTAHRVFKNGNWQDYTGMNRTDGRYQEKPITLYYTKRYDRWVHTSNEGIDGMERAPCIDVIPNLAPPFMTTELTQEDIDGQSERELLSSHDYILARHGARFDKTTREDEMARRHFRGRPWYTPREVPFEQILEELTPVERANLTRLADTYNKKTGRLP
jgi:YARHG domain